MSVEVRYELTKSLIRRAYWANRLHIYGRFGAAVIIVVLCLSLVAALFALMQESYLIGIIIVATVIYMVGAHLFNMEWIVKKTHEPYAAITDRSVTQIFGEDGLNSRTPLGESHMKWPGFSKLLRGKQVWLLCYGAGFVVLPVDALSDEARAMIENCIRNAGLKVLDV